MKIYPFHNGAGFIDLVSKDEHDAVVRELNERLTKQQADMLDTIVQLRAELTSWQLLAERLATALTFWDVNNPALAAYEFATEGSPQMFTPCESCEATLVCSDLGNCCAKSPQFANLDPLAEAVKRMEAVPCPPSAFTDAQWAFAKKKFISAVKGEQP